MKMHEIEFDPPDKLKSMVGEGVEAGMAIELFTTYRVKKNGKWCITMWEGVPAPGYDESGNPSDKDDAYQRPGPFKNNYANAMGGGM